MAKLRQYLYKDNKGVNRWHDHPKGYEPNESATHHSRAFGANGWSTGLESVGAAVHSNQVSEFREDAKKAGFTVVDFKNDGTAVFSSRGERRLYLKHRGLLDRDGGYSD